MKYKCIKTLIREDKKVMSEGDIVISRGDELYNITTGIDHRGITFNDIKNHLVCITDEISIPEVPPSCITVKRKTILTLADEFQAITEKMLDTFKKKNHDYGNSFEQSLDEEGLAGMRIRGGDKWLRFKNLSKGENPLVKDETIKDTLLDLANYCIMTVMWMNKHDNV